MDAEELKKRTKQYSLRIIRLVESLPNQRTTLVIGNQMLRSGTSVGANYRSACRAISKPDFISKACISLEEADESLYWMELLIESGIIKEEMLKPLMNEANEIISILSSSIKTARSHLPRK